MIASEKILEIIFKKDSFGVMWISFEFYWEKSLCTSVSTQTGSILVRGENKKEKDLKSDTNADSVINSWSYLKHCRIDTIDTLKEEWPLEETICSRERETLSSPREFSFSRFVMYVIFSTGVTEEKVFNKLLALDLSMSGTKDYAIDIRDSAIKWVNDIENDKQYKRWSTSLLELLRPTFPGLLRSIKRNLYNLVSLIYPQSLSPYRSIYLFTFNFKLHKI